jgi:hypothetical protein
MLRYLLLLCRRNQQLVRWRIFVPASMFSTLRISCRALYAWTVLREACRGWWSSQSFSLFFFSFNSASSQHGTARDLEPASIRCASPPDQPPFSFSLYTPLARIKLSSNQLILLFRFISTSTKYNQRPNVSQEHRIYFRIYNDDNALCNLAAPSGY